MNGNLQHKYGKGFSETQITPKREIPKASPEPSLKEDSDTEKVPKWCDDGFELFKEHSTFHGVKDLSKANLPSTKCLWILILCVSIFFSIQGCYMIISEYLQRPVVVSYFVAEAHQNLALPDIIICPFNRFNKTYLENLNITGDLAQYLELAFPGPAMFKFQEPIQERVQMDVDKHDAVIAEIIQNMGNMSFSTFMKEASINCEAFFQNIDICKSATELMTSAGKCFRLPGGEQISDGFGYGLKLMITLPKHLYNPGANQMLNDGIVVKLAEPGHGVDHDLTFISSGVHAIMPLSATQYEFMNDPPRYSCLDDSAKNYSRLWCFEYCLTQHAEDICNCSLIAAANPRKPSICTTKQVIKCFYPSMFSDAKEAIAAFQRCKSVCKAPCKYWKYSKTVSTANLSPEQAKAFTNDSDAIQELQNMIILEVFYTSLDYTVIKHMLAMTPSSFIAQLGGQFSLWIGGSVVSVIQFFIYICGGSYAHFYRTYIRRPRITQEKKYKTNFRLSNTYSDSDERFSANTETRI
uniref:Uncharacterized protein n=1 Tax=Panagrolaimus sp. PS1159 TaxID=55785 RepID=A0AC35EXL7_9BILA